MWLSIAITNCGFSQPLQYHVALNFRVAEGRGSDLLLNVGILFWYIVVSEPLLMTTIYVLSLRAGQWMWNLCG
jgi:hypothetical protein